MKFSVLKLLLFTSSFIVTFCSDKFETNFKLLESRKKDCFLSKQILLFYEKAKKENKENAEKAVSVMAKRIFKQDENKKIIGIAIIKDKDLLKGMLDKIFQPDICSQTFKDLINDQKKNAYEFIDNPENTGEFINSKLVSATKYGSYVMAFSIIISGAYFILKLTKYNNSIIDKIDKKYKNIIIKILLKYFINKFFGAGIQFIALFSLSFTIDKNEALRNKRLKINPIVELLTKIILEKIFIRFNSKEEYNDFEEKKEILMLEE